VLDRYGHGNMPPAEAGPLSLDPLTRLPAPVVGRGARKTYGDWQKQAAPPSQPSMPEGGGAPVRIAIHVFDSLRFDPAKAELPPGTDSILAAYRARAVRAREAGVGGRLLSNASLLVLPVALAFSIRRGRRATDRPRRSIGRWALRVIGVVVVYLAVLLGTSIYFGRM
jgi:hypothetical protein